MRYGVFIKDVTKKETEDYGVPAFWEQYKGKLSGTPFRIKESCPGVGKMGSWDGFYAYENHPIVPQDWSVEIAEEEYNRLTKKETKPIHPDLLKAFESGDWGCQEESVKNILIAITKIMEEK